ncbi:DUF4124 domain-containing protein [Thalassotalea sp. ND16A]|uniref:DUF4124 domain-containing protein n=1 Tax=Thalassotalea sp. ND16A TaxID=1535422 RepID=UPI00051A3972|nr:DUF4124 domain-containing protein [Thalassotalea sp. ND16A]KGJ87885.1 hypothetical protein ND16A_2799 [Thalassotalea sp. ND16A]
MAKYTIFVILLFSLIGSSLAASSKVYVWRSESGDLVFSDSPKPGAEEVAEEIEIKNTQTIISSVNTSVLDITPRVVKEDYQVEISQPEDHATIRDNSGSIYISGRVAPVFKQGFKVQLIMNGAIHGDPQTRSVFILRDVDRGEHKIKLELINNQGKVIASSKERTVYLHRTRVN